MYWPLILRWPQCNIYTFLVYLVHIWLMKSCQHRTEHCHGKPCSGMVRMIQIPALAILQAVLSRCVKTYLQHPQTLEGSLMDYTI